MKIKNISTNHIKIHKIRPVAGSPLLQDVGLQPNTEVLLYDEIAEQHTALKDMIACGFLLKTGDAEPDTGVPSTLPGKIETIQITLQEQQEDITDLQLGKAAAKPLIMTANATNPTEVMALVNELKAKINSMNTII